MRQLTGNDVKNIRKFIFTMSQQEFAETIGTSQPTVARVENGKQIVSKKLNEKIIRLVTRYIDEDTLYSLLDGDIEI